MKKTPVYQFDETAVAKDQYFTTQAIAKRMVEWAEISRGMHVLEPSAGDGGLVRCLPLNIRLTAIDVDPEMVARLRQIRHPAYEVVESDFLKYQPKRDAFDLAIMNSPYANGADGKHAAHALRLAQRAVMLVRTNFEYGVNRFNGLFRWATVTRRAVLTRRPPFYGPACKGDGARHDYVVLEMVRRETDRLEDNEPDRVDTEYWTDTWA